MKVWHSGTDDIGEHYTVLRCEYCHRVDYQTGDEQVIVDTVCPKCGRSSMPMSPLETALEELRAALKELRRVLRRSFKWWPWR